MGVLARVLGFICGSRVPLFRSLIAKVDSGTSQWGKLTQFVGPLKTLVDTVEATVKADSMFESILEHGADAVKDGLDEQQAVREFTAFSSYQKQIDAVTSKCDKLAQMHELDLSQEDEEGQ